MAWGWRDRAAAMAITAVLVVAARAAWPDVPGRSQGVYLCVTTLGYGHLIGAAWLARRPALPAPAGVASGLWRIFVWVSVATLLVLYGLALQAWPALVLVMFAISAWHVVENDLALGAAGSRHGALPPLAGAPARNLLALLGTAAIVALGAATPEIAAVIRLPSPSALRIPALPIPGLSGPALAIPLPPVPSLPLVDLFALVTGYHLVAWLLHGEARARSRARAGDGRGARRTRLRILLVHLVPLGCAALALLPAVWAAWAASAAWAAELRSLIFSPGLYLFGSLLHVAQTALARRPRPVTPLASTSRSRSGASHEPLDSAAPLDARPHPLAVDRTVHRHPGLSAAGQGPGGRAGPA